MNVVAENRYSRSISVHDSRSHLVLGCLFDLGGPRLEHLEHAVSDDESTHDVQRRENHARKPRTSWRFVVAPPRISIEPTRITP